MEHIEITLSEDGDVRFLLDDTTACFLEPHSVVRRASHIEPDSVALRLLFHALRSIFGDKGWMASFTRYWPCAWRINLIPIGGSILDEVWYDRQDAIKAEIEVLNANFI
jgi:hypothetical protein